MNKIAIIDYGMGNLRSVQKAFEKEGFDAVVTADPKVVLEAERVVLPGVGAFRDCMRNLEEAGFVEPILKVIREGRPFLGICVGMQLLFTDSTEFGIYRGLDVIPGHVVRFDDDMVEGGEALKVPHMGWNSLTFNRRSPAFDGLEDGTHVYFVHSYYAKPDNPDVVATTTDYGIDFCSAVCKDNVVATQFHPEKSQDKGLTILRNFGKLS